MNNAELRRICGEVLESQHIDSAGADTYRSGIAIAFAAVIPEVLDELEALRTAARDTIAKIDDCADGRINFRRDFGDRLRGALADDPGPALTHRASDYPPHWLGRVPRRVRMLETVTPDWPFVAKDGDRPRMVAWVGRAYYAWVNSHGAVCAILEGGEHLGVKPDEFEVIEWHLAKEAIR